MSNMISQNIFDYATSELSQDAFISLLVAWFDSEKEELRDISKSFISSLYNEYYKKKLIFNKNDSIKIYQQYHKIDIYFELISNGQKIPFIIEDKTWTEPHSNQLLKYVDKVSTTTIAKEKIIKIFFKTGHITEKDEAETLEAGYVIIDIGWIYNFLAQYEIENSIFNDYKEYLKKNFYEKLYINNQKKQLKNWTTNATHNGYVQYAIIKAIKDELKDNILFCHTNLIKFTRNGRQWDTWWAFYNNGFSLFVKIKKIGKLHRIRLIKYSQTKIPSESKQKNLERFSLFINDFLDSRENKNIQKTKKPRGQAREIEIAFLELNNELLLKDVVKEFSNFMQFFLEKLTENEYL